MDQASNPGSATPETLFRMYKDRAAVTANPYVLREMQQAAGLSFAATVGGGANANASVRDLMSDQAAERESLLQQRAIMAPMPTLRPVHQTGTSIGERRRADSPPRGHFKVITHCGAPTGPSASFRPVGAQPRNAHGRQPQGSGALVRGGGGGGGVVTGSRSGLSLTLNSLDMSKR